FFRHMQELIKQGKVYIAQPPLYQVTRGKKSEYVLNEKKMHSVLGSLGMERTRLIVRDENQQPVKVIEGQALRDVFNLLEELDELVTIVRRRGIVFEDFLSLRSQDPEGKNRLPRVRVLHPGTGKDQYFWSEAQEESYHQAQGLTPTVSDDAAPEAPAASGDG